MAAFKRKRTLRPLRRNRRFLPISRMGPGRTIRRKKYKGRKRAAGMSRRRILNVTSRKKQDNMRSWGGTPFNNDATHGPVIMTGDQDWEFMWIATARDKLTPDGNAATVNDSAMRTATTCYMRGLKEKITILTGSPQPWIWRRIVFTYKGQDLITTEDPTHGVGQFYFESSEGFARYYARLNDTTDPRTVSIGQAVKAAVFKGNPGKDYTSNFDAKTNSDRIRVLSDKSRHFRSGNDRGIITSSTNWYPFNKNLVYNEDEDGLDIQNKFYSANTPRSMGDVYVLDFFTCGTGGTDEDELRLLPTATLYWHER